MAERISTHAPRTGSDVLAADALTIEVTISTHAPRTGSDFLCRWHGRGQHISTHAPRTGSDVADEGQNSFTTISTHAPRTGSDSKPPKTSGGFEISTHAPRTGSDLLLKKIAQLKNISTHAPRTGSDSRATSSASDGTNFNPRSPHGERRRTHKPEGFQIKISTHAPRTGSDEEMTDPDGESYISTHAPRTGSDEPASGRIRQGHYFNPRSPHGERRLISSGVRFSRRISTHAPRTGSDADVISAPEMSPFISTHAPRTGSDPACEIVFCQYFDFNPRSPHGERLKNYDTLIMAIGFQPTLPARGATFFPVLFAFLIPISTHAPRTGSDPPIKPL